MTSGIYFIINKNSGNVYVGQSNNIEKRWTVHRSFLNKGKHPNPHLQSSWNTHGGDTFSFIVVEEGPSETLTELEQFWVDYLKFIGSRLFNVASPTCSMLGFKHSEEIKERLRVFHTGNSWAKGNKLSEETRKQMSLSRTGLKHTEESKAKISQNWHRTPRNRTVTPKEKNQETWNNKTQEEKDIIRQNVSEAMKLSWARRKAQK